MSVFGILWNQKKRSVSNWTMFIVIPIHIVCVCANFDIRYDIHRAELKLIKTAWYEMNRVYILLNISGKQNKTFDSKSRCVLFVMQKLKKPTSCWSILINVDNSCSNLYKCATCIPNSKIIYHYFWIRPHLKPIAECNAIITIQIYFDWFKSLNFHWIMDTISSVFKSNVQKLVGKILS